MGDWLLGSIITTALLSLGWFFFTEILPRMAANRAARPPEQPLTVLPGDEHQVPLPIDAETQLTTAKTTHDVFLREADELILGARSAGMFADNLLAEAAEKAGDAVKLRPGSFDANLMAGEIAVKRAELASTDVALDLLRQAADYFVTAAATKKGVIDTYVGRGWAHLERGHRLTGQSAVDAYQEAAQAFAEGFRVNSHNLFILRGWGIAIDGIARTLGEREATVVAAEDAYRLALAEHRSGDHELHAWYAGIRVADDAVQMSMPAVRDRY